MINRHTTSANLADRNLAIGAIARYLKRHDSRSGGMSLKRLTLRVTEALEVRGHNTAPIYFMDTLPGISWYQGCLLKWNSKGGFNVTIDW
jgi:hypothetical protein